MIISATHELYVLFGSALGGVILGMIFDIFRMGVSDSSNVVLLAIYDLILWTVMSVAVFLIIFIVNDGRVRWYEFAGMGIGLVIYFMTLSLVFRKILSFVISTFKKIASLVWKVIMMPIRLCLLILSPVFKLFKKYVCVLKRINKNLAFKLSKLIKRIGHSVIKI